MDNAIKMYQASIRALSGIVLTKKATVRMLAAKYQPSGLWDHGAELIALEAEVAEVEARLNNQKNSLRKATLKAMQTSNFLAGKDEQLF